MATRTPRRRTVTPPPPAPAQPGANATPEPDSLDALIAEFGGNLGGIYLKVSRETPYQRGTFQYLGRLDASHDILEDVKARWGGGNYRAQVKDAGTHEYRTHITFSIAGQPRQDDEGDASAPSSTAPRVPDYVARLQEQFDKLAERLAGPAVPQRDPLELALTIVKAMNEGRPAAGGGDVVATLRLVQEAEDRGMKLGERLGNAGQSDNGMVGLARDFLPPLITAMQAGARQQNRGGPVATVNPPPAPAPVTIAAGYEWLAQVLPFSQTLLDYAVKNRNPEILADLALDELEFSYPATHAEAVASASKPDFIPQVTQTLIGHKPELANHRAWLDEWVARIRETLSEPAEVKP